MKNFTKQNFKTNPLWIRLLIMAFMLLAGAGNVWAAYYLKGGFNSWNTNNELKGSGNDLTTTVELKSGSTYAFKIHNDGNNEWYGNNGTITSDCTWTFSGNDGDAHITASVSGLYTFTFNKSTKKLTVVYPKPTYLLGTLTDWTNGSELPCSINLQANTAYEFKIKQGDTWYGNGGTMTADNSKGWTFGSDNGSNCHIQTSLAGDYYFSLLWEGNIPSISVSYPCDVENSTEIRIECISTSGCPNLHAWTSSNESITGDWPGKAMSRDGNTNIYYYEIERATYKGNTVNIIFNGNNEPQTADIKELEWGKVHRYTRGGVLVYSDCLPEDCTTAEFSVNSLSNLAVGCTATASITGDNVTVTWSSSETSVASIDPNTGVITAETAGETTITATTTDADGFCSGTQKTTKLTVKNPSVSVKANKTILCAGEELTLTATVTDAGTGNTYQWYKGDNSISGAISEAYTISSVSTTDAGDYKVVVNGGIICSALTSTVKSITVYALPSAPTFTSNEATVCSGVAFNLNEKFTRNTGEAGNLTWYKSSDNSQVTDPASVTITEATSYYAKATNNNCTSDESLDCIVNVDANPTLELESTPTVCPNVQIDLDDYATYNTGTLIWYSNQERTTVITDGLVTPTERTTYYAKVTNGTCNPVENEFTVDVYGIADEMPAYTQTKATKCKDEEVNSNGIITLKNPMGGVTYTLDDAEGESNVWTGLSAGTHKLSATVDACSSLTKEWDVNVEVENITPTATVSITGESSFCEGDNTELTCEVETTGVVTAYQWYNGDNLIQGATESTYTANAAGNYKVVVTVENKGCEDTFNATKEVSVKNKPTTPEFNPGFTSICVGGSTTLASGYNWYTELNASALVDLTVSPQTTTTYYATKVENGCTSDAGEFTVTVNPLPTINIGEDVTAVKFEDVELTATGENIHNVEWTADKGTITKDPTDPKRAILTYDQTGDVIVTAKAISAAGCESAEVSKKVTFGEEDCNGTPTTNSNDTKIRIEKNSCPWTTINIYSNGVTDTNSNTWPGCTITKEEDGYYIYEIKNVGTNKFLVVFNNGNSGGANQSVNSTGLVAGKIYTFKIGNASCSQDNDNSRRCLTRSSEDYKITVGPEVIAPAVKMVSVEYDEVNDKIVAKGAVYKTGCGETFWGFQYSTDGQTWGTADADFIRPSTGNSLSVPGEFDYSFAIPNAGGGDIYYIRAYALNNYNGSYALSNAVYSATSLPVEIPSKTIESATISLVDSEGKPLDITEVCPQSTVYLKVSYVGGDFKDYEAADNFPGTNLELVNHDKVNNYAIFSYTATTTGVANITISNENTSVTPEDGVSITVIDVEIATPPTIYLEKNTICDNQTTNVVVNSPIVGSIYSLKNGTVGDPVTYESGDLKFPVSKEGSYTVQVQETVCGTTAISTPVDLRVITSDVKITLTTDVNEISPWQPLTLTVKAPSGYDYDLQGLDGTVYTKSGDVYTIKFPRPDSWGVGNSASESEPKTFTAGIKAGEEPSCSTTTKEIQLVDTEEVCLAPGN